MLKLGIINSLSLSRLALIFLLSITIASCGGGGGGNTPGGSSSDASLSSLTVSKGILQPAFDPDVATYLDAPVPFSDSVAPAYNDAQSASITATATNNSATIKVNGNAVTSGSAYTMSNLAVGANIATIVVTAEDGVTKETYTVTVYRAIPVFKTGAGPISGYTLDPREDGSTQLGVSWPATRFADNGNGTMTDNMTGLVWLKSVSTSTYTWADAITYCEGLTTAAADWRMPNVRELWSLVHYGKSQQSAWLISQGFINVQNSFYWTNTTSASTTNRAWLVYKNEGSVGVDFGLFNGDKTGSRYAIPVRADSQLLSVTGQNIVYTSNDNGTYPVGVSFPSIRFRDNGDGTVTDNMTGLVWLRNANNAGVTMTWSDAFTYIDGLNSGTNSGNCGYTDWRLPTINELETLIDCSKGALNTWLNGQGFSNVEAYYYWSSTTIAQSPGNKWELNMGDGFTVGGTGSTLVWPVRGPVK